VNRPALLLVVAGLTAFIAAFSPFHRDGVSVPEVLHGANKVHDRISGADVPDVQVADHVSTKDAQRDAGVLVRLMQLVMLMVFAPGILLVLFATLIRGEFAIPAGVVVSALGGLMVCATFPFSNLSGMGAAWLVAATVAIAVGVHAVVVGLRGRRRGALGQRAAVVLPR
jgi:hypothetical protein